MTRNIRKYLLLAGIVLIIIGFFLAPYDQFKTDINPEKVQFTSRNDNVKITGNLYLPDGYTDAQSYPAVILVHGINDRAERHHHAAVEFVRRNFIVLAINLRGHVDSGGICTLSLYEPWDIMGAGDWLLGNYNVSNLGLVGHSLGGMSSIRAVHNDSRFNATVVMGAPVSVDLLIQPFVPDFDLIAQFAFYLSFHIDILDPYVRHLISPIYWVNETRPKNFFYVLGGEDTVATVDEALLYIYNATGNTSAVANVAYGDFAAGNRTLLKTYPGIDHGSEPITPEIIVDTILWMENALLGATQGDLNTSDLIAWKTGGLWSSSIGLGFFLCLFPGISYICTSLLNPASVEKPKIASKLKSKEKLLSLGIYTGIFIGASVIVFPIMDVLNYASWSGYNIGGFLVNILTIQGIFLAIGLIAVIYFERRHYNATWIDFGLNKTTTLQAILIGFAISGFLIFGFFILPNLTTMLISFPPAWGAYFLLFLNFLGVTLIGEFYLRGLIQTKLIKEGSRLETWFNLALISLIGGFIQGIATFFIVLPVANFNLSFYGLSINIPLLALLGGTLVFTVLGLLNAWIFQKTQHILPGAIIQATLITWVIATVMVML